MRQTLRLTGSELRRLLMSKKTYLLIGIHLFFIALGYNDFIRGFVGTRLFSDPVSAGMNDIILPFCFGGLFGSVLWGISLLLDADRFKKNEILPMIRTYAKEERMSVARVLAHWAIAAVVWMCSLAVFWPVAAQKMDYLFDPKRYFLYAGLSLLPGIWMTVLLSESLYAITGNISVSALLMLMLTALQFTPFVENDIFYRWNAPQFLEVSDAFGSEGNIRMQIYTRVLLLLVLLTVYAFSLLFVRKFQYGALGSLITNGRNPVKVLTLVVFGSLSALMIWKEPFVDHSPITEWGAEYAEETQEDCGTFSQKETEVSFRPFLGTLKGKMTVELSEATEEKLVFYLNSGIRIRSVSLDGEPLAYELDYDRENTENMIYGKKKGVICDPGRKTGRLVIEYEGYPALARSVYSMVGYQFFDSIGRNYIKLGSDALAPEFAGLSGEKESFCINVPKDHVPTSWGKVMERIRENPDGTVKWKVEGSCPEIVSAPYRVEPLDYASFDTVFEYAERYRKLVEENHMDEAAKEVLNYCDSHYGHLKGAADSDSIRIQQISSDYGGGGAYDGWVYMNEQFLSPKALLDKNAGSNLNETFMHEIIHLFWGDMGCWIEDDGLWSAEGLTVYTTYRMVKEKYGELYAGRYYVDSWKEQVWHQDHNFYFRNPQYLDRLPEKYKAAIIASEDSINKYCRMPLMLLKAQEKLGGEKAMDDVLKRLYEQGGACGTVENPTTFQDFLEVAGLTKEDVTID